MNTPTPSESNEGAIATILEREGEPFYLVRPTPKILNDIVQTAREHSSPTIHVLAAEADLRSVRQQFIIATYAADLVERDDLTLTPTPPAGRGTYIITEEAVYTVGYVDDHQLMFNTNVIPDGLLETCETHRNSSEPFDLRTPAWATGLETLDDRFGADVRDDFATSIETLRTELNDLEVDATQIALLIAARHELLLYDISGWGEDIGLCSKATFSRTKNELTEHNVLETEKVPIDVGRPRLRLQLADEYASQSIEELLTNVDARLQAK
jgi:hypothetical protein